VTNWYAHAKIWEHFDSFLDGIVPTGHVENANAEIPAGAARADEVVVQVMDSCSKNMVSASSSSLATPIQNSVERKLGNQNRHDEFNSRSNLGRVIQL